jgi:hypothetical protein
VKILNLIGYVVAGSLLSLAVGWCAARMVAGGKAYDFQEQQNVREFFERRPEQRLHIVKRSKDVA